MMRRSPLAALVVVGSFGGGFATGVAHAQPKEDLARAESLFNAGKALVDAGQFADACTKFAESKRLAPGLGVTLYLADCYEHVGRTASAWTEFRSAEGLARERNDKRADLARTRAQALESSLARLTIAVSPVIARAGLRVLRDGVAVAEDDLGVPLPVDPGDHVVVVSSPGHKARTFKTHAGPESPIVRVDDVDEPAAFPAPIAPPSESAPTPPAALVSAPEAQSGPVVAVPAAPADPGVGRRALGVGVGGLGVVGVGIGGALGLVAMSKRDQSNSGACDARDSCTDAGLALRRDAKGAADLSTLAFVAGGIALATGVVLYVTAPHTSSAGIVVAPAPIAGGAGALVRYTF